MIILGDLFLLFLVQLNNILMLGVHSLVIDRLVVLHSLQPVQVVAHAFDSLVRFDLPLLHCALLRPVILLVVALHLILIWVLFFACICVAIDFVMMLLHQLVTLTLHLLVHVRVFGRVVLVGEAVAHLVKVLVGPLLAWQVLLKLPIWVVVLH